MATDTKQRQLTEQKRKPPAKTDPLIRLDEIARSEEVREILSAKSSALATAEQLRLADAIAEMRRILTADVMARFASLAGSDLGFMTDKAVTPNGDKGTYSHDDLRDPVIHALIRGFKVVGNEFNIIASRFYAAKAGCKRLCEEFSDDITDIVITPGVPQIAQGGAMIPMYLSYKSCGVQKEIRWEKGDEQDTRICVRVNERMGVDAIIGKASRKVYARFLEILSGMTIMDEPEGAMEGTVVRSKTKTLDDLTRPANEMTDDQAEEKLYGEFKMELKRVSTGAELDALEERYATLSPSEAFTQAVTKRCAMERERWLSEEAAEKEKDA